MNLSGMNKCLCSQPGFFLLRFQFCGLSYYPGFLTSHLAILFKYLDSFSSDHFLILPGIFVYCFDKQKFPKLLAFTSYIDTTMSPTPNFSCFYCSIVVISFELEQIVECLLLCYFTFYFLLFVCCARLVACVFV